MSRYSWIAILFLAGSNVASYLYFNAKIDSKEATIVLEQERVATLKLEKSELETEVKTLNDTLKLTNREYQAALAEYEEYKNRVAGIKPTPVPSIKPIIKEVPAEVVVEQANEGSNEVLRRISNSADTFRRVRD